MYIFHELQFTVDKTLAFSLPPFFSKQNKNIKSTLFEETLLAETFMSCTFFLQNRGMNKSLFFFSWCILSIYVPPTEGGGHIVFGADPVGVRIASFQRDIF